MTALDASYSSFTRSNCIHAMHSALGEMPAICLHFGRVASCCALICFHFALHALSVGFVRVAFPPHSIASLSTYQLPRMMRRLTTASVARCMIIIISHICITTELTFVACTGFVVNGCVNVVITTIERRFGLSSSQTGLVASGYDIASFLALVPVTYFGGRAGVSKPRWVGGGVVVLGLGSLLFALPHFLVGPYRQAVAGGAASSTMCMSTSSVAAAAAAAATVSGNETAAAADVLKVSSAVAFVAQLYQRRATMATTRIDGRIFSQHNWTNT